MLMKSTVRSHLPPAFVTPGTTIRNGERVASSHRANLRQCCFSPRCQPWSLHRQMIVLSRYGDLSSPSTMRPTMASQNEIDARYACTHSFHLPASVIFL